MELLLVALIVALIALAPFGWLWFRSISKPCPDCAERVDKRAKVCRHCGHRFSEAP
jgi:hypothetical protein